MVVKSRLSVLVGAEENVEGYTSNNGTHLVVQGGKNVAVQQKWVIGLAASPDVSARKRSRSGIRSTWKCGRSGGRNAIWEPFFVDGFNVYYDDGANDSKSANAIKTPRYSYKHGPLFEKPSASAGLDLDPASCDIEVLEQEDHTVITQWCALEPGESMAYTKEPGVEKAEAGVFYVDFSDIEDVGLSGLTCTWGSAQDGGSAEIDKCRETMFVYKPAHTEAYASRVARLEEPVGLHPKVLIDLSHFENQKQCEYFMYTVLPRDLFVDKFQSAPLFVFGEHDLEQPEYNLPTNAWGSEAMFRLEPGQLNGITFHSRYVEPVEQGGYKDVSFRPLVFKACDTGNDKIEKNSFYSKGLGYEAYFTKDTIFHHIDSPKLHVQIPRANLNDYGPTQLITLVCVVFSVVYILSKLFCGAVKRPCSPA
ncbi:ZYBA0S14-02520g1_1 [Zygosaccharomyces bailii CLIB 213]|uniref:Protein PBN1 n=1 Tax=Zygosaccharomyces bailii (strain CLIB 213 / ATCC 58445 / CBS 680 / BCRC 21525 / NBRC 1098 / NCYC 1416 / NRRL Y-2227) TaxID=1333698 RepID=A0A8J2TDZ3_ZYGB2|nr:ZYBA0S14-02520g1_1 [Zygosaccharomyces bailii CLIB 213]